MNEEQRQLSPVPRLLLDDTEAAACLGISRAFFLQLLKSGRIDIPVVRLGSRRLFSIKSLEKWIENDCRPNMQK